MKGLREALRFQPVSPRLRHPTQMRLTGSQLHDPPGHWRHAGTQEGRGAVGVVVCRRPSVGAAGRLLRLQGLRRLLHALPLVRVPHQGPRLRGAHPGSRGKRPSKKGGGGGLGKKAIFRGSWTQPLCTAASPLPGPYLPVPVPMVLHVQPTKLSKVRATGFTQPSPKNYVAASLGRLGQVRTCGVLPRCVMTDGNV